MEVMVGVTPLTDAITRGFLNSFINLQIGERVTTAAFALRKQHKIKLPDVIVWATA